MVNKSVQIVIGRGRADPLPHLEAAVWGDFVGGVVHLLTQVGAFYKVHYGTGYSTGGVEENATILGEVIDTSLIRLRNELSRLAHTYDQDAILLVVGELEVIS